MSLMYIFSYSWSVLFHVAYIFPGEYSLYLMTSPSSVFKPQRMMSEQKGEEESTSVFYPATTPLAPVQNPMGPKFSSDSFFTKSPAEPEHLSISQRGNGIILRRETVQGEVFTTKGHTIDLKERASQTIHGQVGEI